MNVTASTSDEPTPATAYADAPSTMREISWVAETARNRPYLAEWQREFQLRKAALLDRIALDEEAHCTPGTVTKAVRVADDAARRLIKIDTLDRTGHEQPASSSAYWKPDTDQDPRAYVRQQYLLWRRSGAHA